MTGDSLRVLVGGRVASTPHQGGAAWAVLQYVLGFDRLGHRTVLLDEVAPDQLIPRGAPLAESDNAAYFDRVVREFGLRDRAALLLSGTRETVGLPFQRIVAAARSADLLVNESGVVTSEDVLGGIPLRAYLDVDPGFTQMWADDGIDMRFAMHDRFVTVGTRIGHPGCGVPTCGREWIPTVPPVVLSEWPVGGPVEHDGLTTVGNWRGYGSVEREGVVYGGKAHSLRPLMGLPTMTSQRFMTAFAIHPDERRDLDALRANGWCLLDPADVAGTPDAYRRFVRGSRAEFGVAKSGYVLARCGWFSDRSAAYLASGRPVIAQDTGFDLPVGRGLLSFATADDVMAGVEALDDDYAGHSAAARAIAEEYLDSDRVLTTLLESLGGAP
ncbi:MAG TPA: hypothetical protein VNN79_12240 [Actinomycetota bacterium]|nr:hypothetical protein [Actinomycetota bacterium]